MSNNHYPTFEAAFLSAFLGILAYQILHGATKGVRARLRNRSFRRHIERQLNKHHAKLISIDRGPTIKPREMDPERPPRFVIHVQAPGDPTTLCTCHQEPLADGDKVLLWPGIELFCQRTHGFGTLGDPS